MGNASPPSCHTWIGLGSRSSTECPCPTGKGVCSSNLSGIEHFLSESAHGLRQIEYNITLATWARPVLQEVVVRRPGRTSQCTCCPPNQEVSPSFLNQSKVTQPSGPRTIRTQKENYDLSKCCNLRQKPFNIRSAADSCPAS